MNQEDNGTVRNKLFESLKVRKGAMGREIGDYDVKEGGGYALTLALIQVATFHTLPIICPLFRIS
jgi:hypothetical protein